MSLSYLSYSQFIFFPNNVKDPYKKCLYPFFISLAACKLSCEFTKVTSLPLGVTLFFLGLFDCYYTCKVQDHHLTLILNLFKYNKNTIVLESGSHESLFYNRLEILSNHITIDIILFLNLYFKI